jgi:protein-tyrosine-phosphatase
MRSKILIICHSNIHRSPFIAEYLRNSVPESESYEVRDRGFHSEGERVPKDLQRAFKVLSFGTLKHHKSRRVTIQDVLWADRIIIMENSNRADLMAMLEQMKEQNLPLYEEQMSKVFNLASYDGLSAVRDPYHYMAHSIIYAKVALNLAELAEKLIDDLVQD